ncbi:RNA polymerase sigma-70 factor (sigma-E family) [Nocardioides thalensis]|uniref:RNA polymerase sigma-70 factor (Sigma-E family) n=1 Tax=Nocardioides thalensis TaxID=1914755 RepID=A0A853BX92_9ACTN|nr:RNA polymerase sigma-70 factor (sigma-E family) [Nocardioides thalensis]
MIEQRGMAMPWAVPVTGVDSATLASQLYAEHRLSLVRLAVLLVDDVASAEDVVHDVFAGLLTGGKQIRDPDAAVGYLRRAVVNRARSMLRRRRTARAYSPPDDASPPGPDDIAVLGEEHRAVLAALQELAPRQREVLVLRYWSDLSEADIADTLGISRGTVKSTASRALAALEKKLGDS